MKSVLLCRQNYLFLPNQPHQHAFLKDMQKIYINNKNTENWKADVNQSVSFYNDWFIRFAPKTYIAERKTATIQVEEAFYKTQDLTNLSPEIVLADPRLVHILRMLTAPPIARDRLSGLASVNKSLIEKMEQGKLPRANQEALHNGVSQIITVIGKLLDKQLLEWLNDNRKPTTTERKRAASIIADRLCGTDANPIIRNEQERRQIEALRNYLNEKGYHPVESKDIPDFREMPCGTYCDHLIVLVEDNGGVRQVRIPVDMVVKPLNGLSYEPPILIECKSAGDYTNTNKRQKEEARKMQQLRDTYGNNLHYILFLCGYFDTSFQGYVASEGIDWVWEHRINDFDKVF